MDRLADDRLALLAREAGAGRDRIILVLDGAGWHTAPGLGPCPRASASSTCRAPGPGAAARRDPLSPCRRAGRQQALPDPRPTRRRRRRAMHRARPRSRSRARTDGLPLVAQARRSNLISRSAYESVFGEVIRAHCFIGGRCPTLLSPPPDCYAPLGTGWRAAAAWRGGSSMASTGGGGSGEPGSAMRPSGAGGEGCDPRRVRCADRPGTASTPSDCSARPPRRSGRGVGRSLATAPW